MDILRKEVAKLLELGIIEESESPWGSPVHLVSKPGGNWRITCDYRALNCQTVADSYSLPLLTDFANDMAGSRIFSSLDLFKGYHQIEIAPEDQCKSVMVTPIGSYKYKRMSMGLRNASQSFQRLMNKVLRGIPNIFVYVDDILVHSHTPEEHLEHLQAVFQRLKENGLVLNRDKCVFGAQSLQFLGHSISAEGIRPLPWKIQAIRDFSLPSTQRQLKRFLGMINFYRPHLQHASEFMAPLDRMLSGKKNSKRKLTWDQNGIDAFERLKDALINLATLSFPVRNAKTILVCDASDVAVGAALNQVIDGESRPLGFFSKTLNKAQRNYSTFDRELLAIYLAVKHFAYFLQDRSFRILTDHQPLTYAMKRNFDDCAGRRLRHLQYISEFTSDLLTLMQFSSITKPLTF